ncbi:hypothetical protein HAV15_001236 [Penicillium sp. str. |nr:hypothetical protein HAV15_001236 [Penicillium sp. str. \
MASQLWLITGASSGFGRWNDQGLRRNTPRCCHGIVDGFAGKQPGYPAKSVQRVLDVIQLQGMGQGKESLLRLPLGTDCFPRTLPKIDNLKVELEQMRDIALSTAVNSA